MGLEPPNSPNFDDAGHSINMHINTRDFSLGFDTQYNRPFQRPVYDVMFGISYDPNASDDHLSFSSWDWEYLRQKLLTLNSTGP